jgi:hypothetical protein
MASKATKKGRSASTPAGAQTPQQAADSHPRAPVALLPDELALQVLNYDFENCPTRLNHEGPYILEDVLAAVAVTRGNFTAMAQLLGRNRTRLREFCLRTLAVKEAIDEANEVLIDAAEAVHHETALRIRDLPALRFILSTKGRNRGYHSTGPEEPSTQEPLAFEVVLQPGEPVAPKQADIETVAIDIPTPEDETVEVGRCEMEAE